MEKNRLQLQTQHILNEIKGNSLRHNMHAWNQSRKTYTLATYITIWEAHGSPPPINNTYYIAYRVYIDIFTRETKGKKKEKKRKERKDGEKAFYQNGCLLPFSLKWCPCFSLIEGFPLALGWFPTSPFLCPKLSLLMILENSLPLKPPLIESERKRDGVVVLL